MSVRIDETDENAIIFDGQQQGIASDPFSGISDLRNCNIVSIPGEASVNFATSKISASSLTGSVISADAGADTVTVSSATGLENYMAIVFSVTTVAGISTGTNPYQTGSIYWIGNLSGTTFKLYNNYAQTGGAVNITSDGTGTFSTINMAQPHHFATTLTNNNTSNNNKQWVVDSLGQVWGNLFVTGTNSYWTYSGNKVPDNAYTNGNGLVAYSGYNSGSPLVSYLFVFHNNSIDYLKTDGGAFTWQYQWLPALSTVGVYASTPNRNPFNAQVTDKVSHQALVSINDNVVYYCDSNFLGSWFTKSGQVFNPADAGPQTTYTFAQQALGIPWDDNANSLTELGSLLLVGGQKNAIYPWDRQAHVTGLSINSGYNTPILIAENLISKMVTVNTNTYIFAGNRGRIYTTNGSQAQLYHKIPDHLSGVVEPYYTWGGACFSKNQLYFSFSVTDNAGNAVTTMGGLWAINLDTSLPTSTNLTGSQQALRVTNQLSYQTGVGAGTGTYAGYATALWNPPPVIAAPTNSAGLGIFIGWDNGASGYGVDTTTSNPYTSSQAYIDYDLIEVGTFYRPNQFKTVEYRLSVPMVTGESVSIYYRLNFSGTYTLIFTSNGSTSSGSISDNSPVNFDNPQWLQLRAVLNSTSSSPSYTRLREIRIK